MSSVSANTTTTTVTATATPLGVSSERTASSSDNNTNRAGEIGLGAAPGVTLVAAAITIAGLLMKMRSERAMRKSSEAALVAAQGYQQTYG